jgi:hypothetical protein
MQTTRTENTAAAIWNRLLHSDPASMSAEAAGFFLGLAFHPRDLDRMHELTAKNQAGELTSEEQEELQNYRQVGLVLDLFRARARLALRQARNGQ